MVRVTARRGAYRIEWTYLGELPEGTADGLNPAEAHCSFLIRFLDVPPGPGHCAFLAVNVITPAKAADLGIGPVGRRGYLVDAAMTRAGFRRRVTQEVKRAMQDLPCQEALAQL